MTAFFLLNPCKKTNERKQQQNTETHLSLHFIEVSVVSVVAFYHIEEDGYNLSAEGLQGDEGNLQEGTYNLRQELDLVVPWGKVGWLVWWGLWIRLSRH